ncbi:hypothetical protein [Paraburkholderia sp. C35]|uniref:lysozyme inhibitor LprI family protein n=1 Tax=Paraburkholderia sp. C35 TaxID=2126993 RepID=UPI001EF6B184|nr:hypothetical protein [Paraburkholderia sp. C35]
MITSARTWRYGTSALLVGAAFALAACGKNTGSVSESSSAKQFPGFQQVGQSGDAAQLWFNPASISRSGSGYIVETLKSFPQGYARFSVVTNCRDSILRQAGTQYRADGTAQQTYPGNDAAVTAKSEPGMTELMSAACSIAMASRAIAGEFNIPAALELLYGPYDDNSKTASWQDAVIPPNLPWRDNLQAAPGKALLVSGVATFDFSEDSKQKKVLVTSAVPDGGGCHACTGLLGVAVFIKDGDKWKVDSNHPYVASMGASGSVGSGFEWVPSGDNSYALVVNGGDSHQGYQTATTTVFVRAKDGTLTQVVDDGDTGVSDTELLSAQTSFVKGKNAAHYDVKVSLTYQIPNQATYVADHVYQYVNGNYVAVKKDGPPKYVQSTEGAPADSSQNTNVGEPAMSGSAGTLQPPATYATSFDCAKARSDAEHLICGDPELANADIQLAAIFLRAKAAVTDQSAFRERVRQQWNYREQNCHDKECLMRWYVDQKVALSQIAQTGRVTTN